MYLLTKNVVLNLFTFHDTEMVLNGSHERDDSW